MTRDEEEEKGVHKDHSRQSDQPLSTSDLQQQDGEEELQKNRVLEDQYQGIQPSDECEDCEVDFPSKDCEDCEGYMFTPSELSATEVNKNVVVRGRVIAEKRKKALPAKISFQCVKCGWNNIIPTDHAIEKFIFKGRRKRETVIKDVVEATLSPEEVYNCQAGRKKGKHKFQGEVEEYQDYNIFWVKDTLEDMEKFKQRENIKCFLLDEELPAVKTVKIFGEVVVDPHTDDICLIADKVKPVETEVETFEIKEKDKEAWQQYFRDKNINEIRTQIAPDMVGRPLVQKARLLTLHSVAEIPSINENKEIRGTVREILFGDTKTFKSDSMEDITEDKYHFGDLVVAESASRTGVVYTIDPDKRALMWGALVLNDMGYVGMDGLGEFHSETMSKLREVLEKQMVKVRRMVSGDALCRVRITGALNPGKNTKESMNKYRFNCLALEDTWIFEDPTLVTRWDLFLPFCDDDVPKQKIANREPRERPIPDDVFKRHVYWAWSRKPEDIMYTEEAKTLIKEKTTYFIKKYSLSTLPIVHNGIREVITRLSVAYASLRHSTDNSHEKVIVRKEFVEKACEFYQEMLLQLDLLAYKQRIEGKKLDEEAYEKIVNDLDETDIEILDVIVLNKKLSSEKIGEKVDLSARTVRERYGHLKKYDLISTAGGASATHRGVQFMRIHDDETKQQAIKDIETGDSATAKVLDIIEELMEEKYDDGVPLSMIKLRANDYEISDEKVEEIVKQEKKRGGIFESRHNYFKVVPE